MQLPFKRSQRRGIFLALVLLNPVLGVPHGFLVVDLLRRDVLPDIGVFSLEILPDILAPDVLLLDVMEAEFPLVI